MELKFVERKSAVAQQAMAAICSGTEELSLIEAKYPDLIEAMQFVACLSIGEAVNCISSLQLQEQYGRQFLGCEAVAHFGGPSKVAESAIRCLEWIK
jgi:hypothetical protein